MPSNSLHEFLNRTWSQYHQATPDAPLIEALLKSRGESFSNDHVAYRTFNLPHLDRKAIGSVFEEWGYVWAQDTLEFPEKKLLADYWIHPDPSLPKVFVSELLLEKVSPELQQWIRSFAEPAAKKIRKFEARFLLEDLWGPVSFEDYSRFYSESEYAAWTAAFGIRVNHFTVNVNSLKTVSSLQELNQVLIEQKFQLNSAGGVIKGTPAEFLEQSSTMAKRIEWKFKRSNTDPSLITQPIMGCYYEFARRYVDPKTGKLFQGFIPKSADKIFESTFDQKPGSNGHGPAPRK